MLKKGSHGDDVKLIQSFLKSLGYKITYVDGNFDEDTQFAVKKYQRKKNINDDGLVGPITLSYMQNDGLTLTENRGASVSSQLVKDFIEKLTFHAERFEGFVEIKNNAAWDDPKKQGIQKEMSDILTRYMLKIKPWSLGQPYCAASVGAFIIMAMEDCKLSTEKFENLWTAHVMTNVRYAKSKNILSITPSLGSVWLARFGSTDNGHTGVVINIRGDNLETIEGNTMSGPSLNHQAQRAGNGIFRRRFHKGGRGSLNTQGFVSAENILKFFVC